MVSHGSLSESKSPQVNRTLLGNQDDLNNAVVWIVSTQPLFPSPPVPVSIFWCLFLRASFTISITITFKFYSFLNFIIIIICSVRVFHINFSWWFFPGVCVTANLLKYPRLFSIFWPFSVIWIVSTRPITSKSSRPFNIHLVIVPKAPITIGTTVTFMFHTFFNSLARSRYLSFFPHSFSFILWSAGTAKSTILQFLFFLLIIIRSGLLAEIKWSVCMSKSHRSLWVSFSMTGAGFCIYHFLVWSNLNFLHISQWITLPTQLCLVL